MRRRDFLRYSGAALAGAYGTGVTGGARASASGDGTGSAQDSDLVLSLKARRSRARILPGDRTSVWRYTGKVLAGDGDALTRIPGSYLGPTIRVRKGQRVRIEFRNRLPEETIVHWHGLHVPADMDGHPRFAVGRGGKYVYEFDVVNRAGTYWYHPHPHGLTGKQVYFGLAGLFIVSDDEEDALGLPTGDRDLPLVIQDRFFDASNQLVYGQFGFGPHGGSGMGGFLGSNVLVNGVPDATIDVPGEPHRLRLLNGSNTRMYKIGWIDGTPLDVIGNDGGLLRRPVRRDYVTMAPAERIDLWVDFSRWPAGTELKLGSMEFDDGMFGITHQHLGGVGDVHMGDAMDILTVRVGQGSGGGALPSTLSAIPRLDEADAANAGLPKQFELSGLFGNWTLNGRTFEMTAATAEETVQLGTMEVIDLVNTGFAAGGMGGGGGGGMGGGGGGGGMGSMSMAHPIHMHGQQFQILERSIDPAFQGPWHTVQEGYVDEGWKDTVLLMPGERVRLLKRFDDHPGLFLYHCHNLEHEDMGMMRNLNVIG